LASEHHTDIDLMMFADGELGEGEARALERAAASEPDVSARLAGIDELGECVRTLVETSVDAADESGKLGELWRRVEGRLDSGDLASPDAAAASAAGPGAGVAMRKRPGITSEEPGFWHQVREWFRGRTAVAGLVAAGAVTVAFLAVRPFERVVERRVEIVRDVPVEAGPERTPPATQTVSQPAEVEDLEVYEGSGMILTIPGDKVGESPTTVLWLSSDDTVEGPI
jgi:anti-sigma factor RsiW